GTGFQKEVWEVLQQIPYGEVLSYGQVAKTIGRPQAQRAVGMACNRNPVPIVVPCHRVLGTNGRLTGYAGGLDIKVRLLELEKKNSK
ncbi:MAG TPA: methylated-DNA--[protein]-cysteine S-methyltransferase, partial [Bacteroidales bacterium]|nr:methylated-DNA--[protein]-cysteine S-methyltransferase [Bacteroidales bacterium]